jgi:hypothetical protein
MGARLAAITRPRHGNDPADGDEVLSRPANLHGRARHPRYDRFG